jgi:hypothetical protein
MTSRHLAPFAFALVASFGHGCAEVHAAPDASTNDAFGDAPRTCELSSTRPNLVLEPAADNPGSCRTPAPCELWFGHGQHLRCPRYLGAPSPIGVSCDFGFGDDRCVCDDGLGFVADFATAEVIHTRDGATCRYRVVLDAE